MANSHNLGTETNFKRAILLECPLGGYPFGECKGKNF